MPEEVPEEGSPAMHRVWPFTSEKDAVRAAQQYVSLKTPLPQKKKLLDRLLVTHEFAVQAAPIIVEAVHREDISTRHTFLDFFESLVNEGKDLSVISEEIARIMGDPNFALREKAAKLLMKMGPSAAGATVRIFSLLRNKMSDIQLNAVRLLGRIGPVCAKQAIPKIEQMLKGVIDKEVKDAARDTLLILRGEKDVEDVVISDVPVRGSSDYPGIAGKNILVVDDEAGLRRMLASSFRKFGANVTEAVDGKEAFDLINSDLGFDVVLLDLMLPIMSGAEILRLIRQDKNMMALPVYIISARTERSILMAMAKLDIAGYFMKPFKIQEILQRVNSTLSDSYDEGSE